MTNKLRFTKMHGLGNDFMVIDGINQQVRLTAEEISQLSQTKTGIGFDQCLLIEKSTKPGIDFNYRIFNADGSEVGQCGNGARCLALFVKHYGLTQKNSLTIATRTTQMHLQINNDQSVTVDMGIPQFTPQSVPFVTDKSADEYILQILNKEEIPIHIVNVGNPHAVLLVENSSLAAVESIGQQISTHNRFPEQTNTGFMQIINSEEIMLRVYERGCGETKACGSGAVAAAAVGRFYHRLESRITVHLNGGDLFVEWPDISRNIFMTGPATFVYEGILI